MFIIKSRQILHKFIKPVLPSQTTIQSVHNHHTGKDWYCCLLLHWQCIISIVFALTIQLRIPIKLVIMVNCLNAEIPSIFYWVIYFHIPSPLLEIELTKFICIQICYRYIKILGGFYYHLWTKAFVLSKHSHWQKQCCDL